MKNLKEYLIFNQNAKGNINEGLLSRKISTKTPIRYRPKTKAELIDIIITLLKQGITDLNCIDVSKIDDMSFLFWAINKKIQVKDIDISEWDVSNVITMAGMFCGCYEFNSDLSEWDISNVTDIRSMFWSCYEFNSDLSNWQVSNVRYIENMFTGCITLKKNNKIPSWYNGKL